MDYPETLSPSAWPSQQITGPRCDTAEQNRHIKTSKLSNLNPQTTGIDRLEPIAFFTQSYQVRNQGISMVRNNPIQHCAAGGYLSVPQGQDWDQEQDVAMTDAAGDGALHRGQEQDGQPDQELPLNLEAPGPGQQEE